MRDELQIAVLREGTIAEVRPETVQCPCVLGQELTLGFETGVGIPELRAEDEAAVGFGAAGVSDVWVGVG